MASSSLPPLNSMNSFGQLTPSSVAPAPVPIPTTPLQQAPVTKAPPQKGDSSDEKSNEDENKDDIWSSAKANRRTKERKISFVIEKVSMWRKLYNGIQDNQGKIVRYR